MRKLRVDLRGSSLFVALLMKYSLLNRQIFPCAAMITPLTLHRRPLQPFTVKAVQLRLPQDPNLLLRPQ